MKKAFTLLEIVIVLGLFSIVSLLVFPISISQSQSSKIDYEVSNFASLLKLQQQKAYAMQNNASYGIYMYSDKYVTYQGSSFASATDKVIINFPNEVKIDQFNLNTGGTEINFTAGSFRPNAYGNVRFTTSGIIFIFDINSEGLIRYYKQ